MAVNDNSGKKTNWWLLGAIFLCIISLAMMIWLPKWNIPYHIPTGILIYFLCFWLSKGKKKFKENIKNTGLEGKVLESYIDLNAKLITWFLFVSIIIPIIVSVLTICKFIDNRLTISDYYVTFSLLIDFVLFILLLFFVPRQPHIFNFEKRRIDKNLMLSIWNYYAYFKESINNQSFKTNWDMFWINKDSITVEEANKVYHHLSCEPLDNLEVLNILVKTKRHYREGFEILASSLMNNILRVISSLSFITIISTGIRTIFEEHFKINDGQYEFQKIIDWINKYGLGVILIIFFILLMWFILGMLFHEFSYKQRRIQIGETLPKMIESIIEQKKEKN